MISDILYINIVTLWKTGLCSPFRGWSCSSPTGHRLSQLRRRQQRRRPRHRAWKKLERPKLGGKPHITMVFVQKCRIPHRKWEKTNNIYIQEKDGWWLACTEHDQPLWIGLDRIGGFTSIHTWLTLMGVPSPQSCSMSGPGKFGRISYVEIHWACIQNMLWL